VSGQYVAHDPGTIVKQLLEPVDLLLRVDVGLGFLLDPALELLPCDRARAVFIDRRKRILVHPAAHARLKAAGLLLCNRCEAHIRIDRISENSPSFFAVLPSVRKAVNSSYDTCRQTGSEAYERHPCTRPRPRTRGMRRAK
jgi:hypothetical protein